MLAQFLVSLGGGTLLGATYALIGLGLVQAFRSTGTFNFAHGQLMIFPAFLVVLLENLIDVGFWAVLPIALVIAMLLGMVMFALVLRRTVGLPHFVGFAATLGVAAILDGILQLTFGSAQRSISIPGLPSGRIEVGGAGLSIASIVLAGAAIFIAIVVVLAIRKTSFGLRNRAAGQDAVLASQSGINVTKVYLGSWALAGLLAGLAGIVYTSTVLADTSSVGIALAAFPAIILGGLDSIEGAIAGGLIIGVVQGFAATFLGGEYVDVVTYVILLGALLLFPSGFFGTKEVSRL